MDLHTLQAAALAAREIEHPISLPAGDVLIRLRLPTGQDVKLAAWRTGIGRTDGDKAALLVLQRGLIEQALIGWQGVRVGHILPGHVEATAPLPWDAGAVPLLLDAQPEAEQALFDLLNHRLAARNAAVEADAKN